MVIGDGETLEAARKDAREQIETAHLTGIDADDLDAVEYEDSDYALELRGGVVTLSLRGDAEVTAHVA
jgi:hypothetical protein